jgi:chromate reductase, NAD(P)H dehydrogenase (quinone)
MIKILAISGSLRSRSSNTRLIRRVAEIAGDLATVDIFADLDRLPHFNPDNEPLDNLIVSDLTQRMRSADGLLVSTPEYAHGLPGTLKNALDWLVGTDAFIEKPFTLFQADDRSIYAPQSLIEILKTMSGLHVETADLTIDLRSHPDRIDEILRSKSSNSQIESSLKIMSQFMLDRRSLKIE